MTTRDYSTANINATIARIGQIHDAEDIMYLVDALRWYHKRAEELVPIYDLVHRLRVTNKDTSELIYELYDLVFSS